MSWKVKRGNTSIQEIPIYDKNGALVTNLSSATDIRFQVRDTQDAEQVLIEKAIESGVGGIEVDQPSQGYLRISIYPDDTTASGIEAGKYVMGLQIKWSDTLNYEVILEIEGEETIEFEIESDIVRP